MVTFEQTGLLIGQRRVTTTRCTQPFRRLDPSPHLGLGLDHRVPAHPRRGRHRRLATTAQYLGQRSRCHPPLPLVQVWQHHIEEPREPFRRDLHTATVLRAY